MLAMAFRGGTGPKRPETEVVPSIFGFVSHVCSCHIARDTGVPCENPTAVGADLELGLATSRKTSKTLAF